MSRRDMGGRNTQMFLSYELIKHLHYRSVLKRGNNLQGGAF